MNVGCLAGRSEDDMPEGGKPWHEYTNYLSALVKFFPDETLAPFIPAAYAAKNRRLMQGCVRALRKHKLGAAFRSQEPFFLDERFFERYPQLRGPRVDHPRRSRHA